MGFAHRKLLKDEDISPPPQHSLPVVGSVLRPVPDRILGPPLPHERDLIYNTRFIEISMACVIGVSILLVIVTKLTKRCCSRRNNSRRRNPPILFGTQEDFLDEDQGPVTVIDHPIWLIHTIGLHQSVIDSITVCKYKKDEGLIEGTECSICLGEFEEDENLRLLPKCSHAFHLPCIDTWLRSHKNCPMCRAPIVRDGAGSQVSETESSLSDLSSSQETQVENLENYVGVESNQFVEGGSSEPVEDSRDSEISKKSLQEFNSRNSHSRVMSNLVDNRRVSEEELQPVRRSVSLDLSTATTIYQAVANVVTDQGNSKIQLVSGKSSNTKIVGKRDGGTSSSLSKLVKSSSIGLSLQKGPISMKRSFSSSRKFLSSTHFRSSSSVLPL